MAQPLLITGASSGIGKATALLLAGSGYSVYAGVRRESDAEQLRRQNAQIRPLLLDVTRLSDIEQAVQRIRNDFPDRGLYALINNAAFNYNAPFEHSDEAKARALMETNFFGLYRLTQAALPMLRQYARTQRDTAKVVNIGSIGSLVGIPWESFYHASKFALMGLSESLQHETYAQGVRVSVVCPGGVKTPFISKTEEVLNQSLSALPDTTRDLYAASMRKLIEASAEVDRFGSPPERVAGKILRILKQRNPPFRVLVGTDAHLMNAMRGILPRRWFHGMLRSLFTA